MKNRIDIVYELIEDALANDQEPAESLYEELEQHYAHSELD